MLVQKLRDSFKNPVAAAGLSTLVVATALTGTFGDKAHAQDSSVVFSYGKNVDSALIDRHLRGLERRGIKAQAVQNLDAADCVALVIDGEERLRLTSDDMKTPQMSSSARLIL